MELMSRLNWNLEHIWSYFLQMLPCMCLALPIWSCVRPQRYRRLAKRLGCGKATVAVARKLAEWVILRSEDNGATVERYRAFFTSNPSWPSWTHTASRVNSSGSRAGGGGVVLVGWGTSKV